MKIVIFFLFAVCMQVSAHTNAQRVTLKLQNVPLKSALNELSKQSGLSILYNEKVLSQMEAFRGVSISVKDVPVEQALSGLLIDKPFQFKIEASRILLEPRRNNGNWEEPIELPAAIDVRGRIMDNEGNPVSGASVQVKGQVGKGTSSDNNGYFSLNEVGQNDVLLITGVNIDSREIRINNRTDLGTIVVQINVKHAEEVVVSTGYWTTTKRLSTGSISKVTGKQIENQPVLSPLQALQGRMAGVNITQISGIAGGGIQVQIRGMNSLRNFRNSNIDGNAPLYVVDGVVMPNQRLTGTAAYSAAILVGAHTNPLNAFNPNDIESIEVLKDADATAIYGSRGANGVILVTTKKGVSGKMNIAIQSDMSFSKASNFMEMMNASQFNKMREEAFANDGITTIPAHAHDMNGNWDRTRNTDWQKELLGGTAKRKNLQLTLSGGNENTQYHISGGMNNETTIFPTDDLYNRKSLLINLNHKSSDGRFVLNTSTSYSNQKNNLVRTDITTTAMGMAPVAPALFKEDGSLNWENGTFQNPLSAAEGEYSYNNEAIVINSNFKYKIAAPLFFRMNMGFTSNFLDERLIEPNTMYNPSQGRGPDWSVSQKGNAMAKDYIIEPQLIWEKKINKHAFSALAGFTYQSQTKSNMGVRGSNFSSNILIYDVGSAKTKTINILEGFEYRYAALYGRLNYIHDNKYIVNLTGRRDGSSRFGPDNKFGNFGAVGAAWIFSNESFLKSNSILSFGKLRSSIGTTGSDNIGDYQFLDTYNMSGALYDNLSGLFPSKLYNPIFGWEQTTKFEIGLELGLFDRKINPSITWYSNTSSNQLVGIPLPATTGFPSVQGNLNATVANSGWEITVNAPVLQQKNFNWELDFNLSFPKNILKAFPNLEGSTYSNTFQVGKSLNARKLYQYEGIDPVTGKFIFTDFNKDGRITSLDDKKFLKEPKVNFYGGLQNSLSYQNFYLDFHIHFVSQTNFNYNSNLGYPGNIGNKPVELLDRWSPDNPNATYMAYSTGVNQDINQLNEYFAQSTASISDASYVRLKNVSLSYLLKPQGKYFQALKLYVQGQNLLTITNYFGIDPESMYIGYVPPLKTLSLGIQLTF